MNGIIIINKPLGYTSRDVVDEVSKCFKTKKVGHAGTLDPNASGVLIVCVNKGLKVCELFSDCDKEYETEIILGIETDTLDMDKNATIIREENVNIDEETLKKVVNSFKGKYMQEVPKYSAVKINGKKLYEYARSGVEVELPKKEVEIKDIEIISDIVYRDGKGYFKIRTTVSKGTYIRSLVRDIGNKLGIPMVVNQLTRTKIGNFSLSDCCSLEDVRNNNYKLLSIMDSFPNIPIVKVNDNMAYKIRNGVIMDHFFDSDMAFITDKDNNLLALYKNIYDKSRAYKMFI